MGKADRRGQDLRMEKPQEMRIHSRTIMGLRRTRQWDDGG